MIAKLVLSEMKWITFAFVITVILVTLFSNNVTLVSGNANYNNTFFGLSKFFENLVFFIFSTFVVYGIKGFFERYSQKIANVIMIVTGSLLSLAIVYLCYQILFKV